MLLIPLKGGILAYVIGDPRVVIFCSNASILLALHTIDNLDLVYLSF